jgi:hypothetical protein
MSFLMKTWPTLIPVVALAFAAACSSAPPAPAKPTRAEARAAKAAEAKGDAKGPVAAPGAKSVEARADELIADLKKRQEEQVKIHEKATGRVPVVVEVSPNQSGGGSRPSLGPGVYPGSSAAAGINSADANYWRQEYVIASARLQQSQRRLEDARRRMSEAQQQYQSPNAALRKLGQEAMQRAQAEYTQAQNAYYEDQSAVSRARSAALQAGVPSSALR